MRFLNSDPSEPGDAAIPHEELELTPSEVHYIREHTAEDRRIARNNDLRIQQVEKQVYHLSLMMRWLLGIVSAGFVGLALRGL